MRIIRILLLTFTILTALLFRSYSQKEAYNWYFGDYAGITFSSGNPVALPTSKIYQSEGNATVSDSNGNLLFYTDGMTIWNKNQNVMANGSGLGGQNISAQSALIAKLPLSDSIYYVFTVPDWANSSTGLAYSIVDMSLSGGNGQVISKNILLNGNCKEQVTAIYNCGGIFIVSHEHSNNKFVVYELTNAGLITTPVVSHTGMIYAGSNRYGYLKFSQDGKKLCSTFGGVATDTTVQLFDFNLSTGLVSNPVSIAINDIPDAYSSEFSPDGSKLYVVAYNGNFIYQYNLSSGIRDSIIASMVNVATGFSTKACVQIGPDKRIYVARVGNPYIGVILNPNNSGLSCHYIDNGVSLSNGVSELGLPNFFPQNLPNTLPLNIGNDTSICTSGSLILNATTAGATYHWQDNTTSSTDTVTQSGTYSVTVSISGCIGVDSVKVNIGSSGPVDIMASDSIFCAGDSSMLCATPGFSSYQWNVGVAGNCIEAQQAGDYYVTATDANGCTAESNHIPISTYPVPSISIVVQGDTLSSFGAVDYQWYFNNNPISNATGTIYIAIESGSYSLEITDTNGCKAISSPVAIIITGINEVATGLVSVYPNPSVGSWQLTVGNELTGSNLEVYDEEGQIVFQSGIRNPKSEINLNVASGVYFLRISSANMSIVKKLMKL